MPSGDDGVKAIQTVEMINWVNPLRCFICDGIVSPGMPTVTLVTNVSHEWCSKWFNDETKKIKDDPRYQNTGVLLATPRDWMIMCRKEEKIRKLSRKIEESSIVRR